MGFDQQFWTFVRHTVTCVLVVFAFGAVTQAVLGFVMDKEHEHAMELRQCAPIHSTDAGVRE